MSTGTLDDALRRASRNQSHRVAVRSGSSDITFSELDRAAACLAAGLRTIGVRPGDRVAIALGNSLEAAVSIYGAIRAGGAIVPLRPTIKASKLARLLAGCSASALICEASTVGMARNALRAVPDLQVVSANAAPSDDHHILNELLKTQPCRSADAIESDLAAIIYTSGSTGSAKGVTLTHRNMVFAVNSIAEYLELDSEDRVLSVLPLSFDYGLYQLFLCMQVGASLLLEPGAGYPGRLVSLMLEQKVTGLPGVPTLFRLFQSLPGFGDHPWLDVRFLTSTGEVLTSDMISYLRSTFPGARLYSMYGLTECKRVSYLPPDELSRRPDSVGIPIPGTQAWIEDANGQVVGPGRVGELMVRGPHVMQGYWGDPDATSERLRQGRWPWDRTLRTGDLFRCDEEGYLYFVGRQDDMIKSRGERVYPREIEQVLLAAPSVLEAAVVGIADERLGQAICAHVVEQPGQEINVDQLYRFCEEHLEAPLVPRQIIVHDRLPTTAHGKVDRRSLARMEPNPDLARQP